MVRVGDADPLFSSTGPLWCSSAHIIITSQVSPKLSGLSDYRFCGEVG